MEIGPVRLTPSDSTGPSWKARSLSSWRGSRTPNRPRRRRGRRGQGRERRGGDAPVDRPDARGGRGVWRQGRRLVGLGADGEEGIEKGAAFGAQEMERWRPRARGTGWLGRARSIPNDSLRRSSWWSTAGRSTPQGHRRGGGMPLSNAWITIPDLIAIGVLAREEGAEVPAESSTCWEDRPDPSAGA